MKASYEKPRRGCAPAALGDVAEAAVWLVDGARTVTGELVLLASGMHLGGQVNVPGAA